MLSAVDPVYVCTQIKNKPRLASNSESNVSSITEQPLDHRVDRNFSRGDKPLHIERLRIKETKRLTLPHILFRFGSRTYGSMRQKQDVWCLALRDSVLRVRKFTVSARRDICTVCLRRKQAHISRRTLNRLRRFGCRRNRQDRGDIISRVSCQAVTNPDGACLLGRNLFRLSSDLAMFFKKRKAETNLLV